VYFTWDSSSRLSSRYGVGGSISISLPVSRFYAPVVRLYCFSSMNNLYPQLCDKKVYREVFNKLRAKAKAEKRRLSSTPCSKSVSLRWILANESYVVRSIIREIRSKSFSFSPALRHSVKLDKQRDLFSLPWPERIVEAAISELVNKLIEPQLSEQLFSFRKGRGNLCALNSVARFLVSNPAADIYCIKRDISRFGESIEGDLLWQSFQGVLDGHDPYVITLVKQLLSPLYTMRDTIGTEQLEIGLPTGFCITPISENLFLSDLDHALVGIQGGHYARFGDDILLMHPARSGVLEMKEILDMGIRRKSLAFKEEKGTEILLSNSPDRQLDTQFRSAQSFDYLGYSVSRTGLLFLSSKKLRLLKRAHARMIQYAAIANRRHSDLLPILIATANHSLEQELRHPYMSLLFSTPDINLDLLRQLDVWMAKQVLRPIYGSGHGRVFKRKSLVELRRMGLVSLVDLYNRRYRLRGMADAAVA